jgi:hypothetical protein
MFVFTLEDVVIVSGLVVRGPGSDSWPLGLERGRLSVMRIIEELHE